MNNKISKEKVLNIVLMMVIVAMAFAMVITLTENENLEAQVSYKPEPVVVKGEYTYIQYTPGWVNNIYLTEYYIDGDYLYFKEKGCTGFKTIRYENLLPVDGWIEGDKLMDYGYWVPDDLGLDSDG